MTGILLLGIQQGEMNANIYKNAYKTMFVESQLIMAKSWKQPTCLLQITQKDMVYSYDTILLNNKKIAIDT